MILSNITFSYCLFMLTCFGDKWERGSSSFCPVDCVCYYAPNVGIKNTAAVSLICDYFPSNLKNLYINTLVIKDQFQSPQTRSSENNHVISLVFENFTLPNLNNTFKSFNEKILKYLTIYNSHLDNQFWSSISHFSNIEAIHIKDSYMPMLGDVFREANWTFLNRLIIKSANLKFIDLYAFIKGKDNLRMLVMSGNELKSLLWLIAPELQLTKLWHLDLQSNQLSYLPSNLKDHLPNVKVLRLGGNRFLYFELTALEPWFDVDEVNLYEFTSENKTYTTLPHTIEITWLKNLDASQVKASFLISSFVSGFSYECPASNSSLDWTQFVNNCSAEYEVLPDHLYFNSDQKLVLNRGNQSETILIEGDSLPLFDHGLTSFSQLTALQLYLPYLSSGKNAIRIHLFSKKMLNLLITEPNYLNAWETEQAIEHVTMFLDGAEAAQIYVLLVLWTYEDIVENVDSLHVIDWKTLEELLLKPLFKRLRYKKALIGIEIISNYLNGEFKANTKEAFLEETTCSFDDDFENSLFDKKEFLNMNVLIARSHLGSGKAIGISIPATCYLCLPMVTFPPCLPDINDFDFITIFSNVEEVESEVYSYVNWQENVNSTSLPPIFYVLKEVTNNQTINVKKLFAIASVKQFTSGYFSEYTDVIFS